MPSWFDNDPFNSSWGPKHMTFSLWDVILFVPLHLYYVHLHKIWFQAQYFKCITYLVCFNHDTSHPYCCRGNQTLTKIKRQTCNVRHRSSSHGALLNLRKHTVPYHFSPLSFMYTNWGIGCAILGDFSSKFGNMLCCLPSSAFMSSQRPMIGKSRQHSQFSHGWLWHRQDLNCRQQTTEQMF